MAIRRRPAAAIRRPPLAELLAPAVRPEAVLADGLVAAAELVAGPVAEPAALEAAAGADEPEAPEPVLVEGPVLPRPKVDWVKLARASVSLAWLTFFMLVLWVLSLLPWRAAMTSLASVFRTVSAAADTTAVVFTAASNLTSAAAQLSLDGLQETRTFMHEAMRGVEIFDLNSAAVGHTIVATSAKALGEWLKENATAHNIPDAFVDRWLPQLHRFDEGSFLQIELSHSVLNASAGTFSWGVGEAKRLDRHSVGLRFVMVRMSFNLGWTNPLWDVLGMAADSQHDQVMQLLTRSVELHPLHQQYLAAQAWQPPQRRWFG